MKSDLIDTLKSSGIVVVEGQIQRPRRLSETDSYIEIQGDPVCLLNAARGLGVTVVFYEEYRLTEDSFMEESYGEAEGEDEDDEDYRSRETQSEIDLRSITPELDAFTNDIGSIVSRYYFMFHQTREFRYDEESPRYKEFLALKEKASTIVMERAGSVAEQQERERRAKLRDVSEKIRALATSPAFVQKARTRSVAIRALVAYVRETVDGAAEIDSSELTRMVRAVRDALIMS